MTLQDKLDVLRQQNVPLPLVGVPELTQALRLRKAGLTYDAIAKTMTAYHGSTRTSQAWRSKLRAMGAPPRHHGNGVLRRAPQEYGS